MQEAKPRPQVINSTNRDQFLARIMRPKPGGPTFSKGSKKS